MLPRDEFQLVTSILHCSVKLDCRLFSLAKIIDMEEIRILKQLNSVSMHLSVRHSATVHSVET